MMLAFLPVKKNSLKKMLLTYNTGIRRGNPSVFRHLIAVFRPLPTHGSSGTLQGSASIDVQLLKYRTRCTNADNAPGYRGKRLCKDVSALSEKCMRWGGKHDINFGTSPCTRFSDVSNQFVTAKQTRTENESLHRSVSLKHRRSFEKGLYGEDNIQRGTLDLRFCA